MSWEKINEMFPDGWVGIDNDPVPVQDIIDQNIDMISYTTQRQIRATTQEIKRRSYHSDNSLNVDIEYSVFPPILIDGIPLLNAYAQKGYNDFCQKHNVPYNSYSIGGFRKNNDCVVCETDIPESTDLTFEEFLQQQ